MWHYSLVMCVSLHFFCTCFSIWPGLWFSPLVQYPILMQMLTPNYSKCILNCKGNYIIIIITLWPICPTMAYLCIIMTYNSGIIQAFKNRNVLFTAELYQVPIQILKQVDFAIGKIWFKLKNCEAVSYSLMIICCPASSPLFFWPSLNNRNVHVLGQCQLGLLIQVVFPVILSSQCKHLQLFTVKCPLCSPSLPVCFQHYSTCCTYCIVLPYCSIQQREVTGRVTCEVIVSREKINADWSRHDLLPEAGATEAPAKQSFFKWERSLFNSCIGSQAGRQCRGERDKRKQNAKTENTF